MNVLVIAAHPDDEVLGCGGTMAAAARASHNVDVAILGEGASSRHQVRDDVALSELEALRNDARAAVEIVGARAVHFGGLPDNRFDAIPLLDIVKKIEAWVRQTEPDVIYTHHPGDLNVDHGLTFRAVLTATVPVRWRNRCGTCWLSKSPRRRSGPSAGSRRRSRRRCSWTSRRRSNGRSPRWSDMAPSAGPLLIRDRPRRSGRLPPGAEPRPAWAPLRRLH